MLRREPGCWAGCEEFWIPVLLASTPTTSGTVGSRNSWRATVLRDSRGPETGALPKKEGARHRAAKNTVSTVLKFKFVVLAAGHRQQSRPSICFSGRPPTVDRMPPSSKADTRWFCWIFMPRISIRQTPRWLPHSVLPINALVSWPSCSHRLN